MPKDVSNLLAEKSAPIKMDAEKWQKIKIILEGALEITPAASRSDYIKKACAGNEDVQNEVEALLEFDDTSVDLLEQTAFSVAMRDEPAANTKNFIGQQIGNYKIVSELGTGGMGAVYLATRADGAFEQNVALKIVKKGMDSDAVLRRFLIERQILAQLKHPNIAHLIDGGTTDEGSPYFVMEHVEGEPLNDFANRQNLSLEERLHLFRQICQAVSFAHSNLVIHRDLKPSNILITKDGAPKLLDFGIAKLLKSEAGNETDTHTFVFTPEYASPEQVRGEKLTPATDVYSLGVILYELLTGTRPYKTASKNISDIIKAISETPPVRPSSLVISPSPDKTDKNSLNNKQRTKDEGQKTNLRLLKGDLDNIILKALRKEIERRYASVEQFSEDIRRHLEGLPVTARKDTVLYRSSKFFQRHFVNNWRNALVPLMLSILLVAIGLGLSIYWVKTKAESVTLAAAENKNENKKTSRHETVSQTAHEAYLKGRFLWNKRTVSDIEKAIELFNQAVTIEPNYAEAYTAIAEAYVILAMGQPKDARREMIEKGRAAALRAIEIDNTLAEPHVSLGFIAYDYDWNWDVAEKEYRRAIELNPNYPTAHHWYAYLLQNIGRHDEALAEIKRARELDPLSAPIARDVAEILHHARRSDEAIEQLRKRIELDENDIRSRTMLAIIYKRHGRYQESIDEGLKVVDRTNRESYELGILAASYLGIGRKAEAQALIREAKQRGLREIPFEYYTVLCNKNKIFEQLEEKYNNRDGLITNLKVNPLFDCIRSDPRYDEMIRKIGLP